MVRVKLFASMFVELILCLSFMGCSTLSQGQPYQDSSVDSKLSNQAPSPSAPQAAPETPREGFTQEPKGTSGS